MRVGMPENDFFLYHPLNDVGCVDGWMARLNEIQKRGLISNILFSLKNNVVGELAQMVERLLSMEEVTGSMPVFSIFFFTSNYFFCFALPFANYFLRTLALLPLKNTSVVEMGLNERSSHIFGQLIHKGKKKIFYLCVWLINC